VYDDIQDEIVKKLEENVDDITNLLQIFMDKMEGIYNDTLSIANQTQPISDQEFQENNAEIQKMREKLRSLAEKVKQEMMQQEEIEGLEKTIQTFLTFSRNSLSETVSQFDLYWSKTRQNEVLEFKNFEAFADATEDLQDIVTKLFDNLEKVLFIPSRWAEFSDSYIENKAKIQLKDSDILVLLRVGNRVRVMLSLTRPNIFNYDRLVHLEDFLLLCFSGAKPWSYNCFVNK